jgi:hypothetical protein
MSFANTKYQASERDDTEIASPRDPFEGCDEELIFLGKFIRDSVAAYAAMTWARVRRDRLSAKIATTKLRAVFERAGRLHARRLEHKVAAGKD